EHGAALLANFAQLVRRHHASRSSADSSMSQPVHSLRRAVLDFTVPTEILFDELFAQQPVAFWLDSSKVEHGLSRYSFLGDSGGPLGEVLQAQVGSGVVQVGGANLESRGTLTGSIFDVLDQRLRDARMPWDPGMPFDLTCGYVGYFGYEMKAECDSPNRHASDQPDALWMLATRMVAVDHETGRTWVLALADGSEEGVRA